MSAPQVDILMPTYNGAPFLPEQLASLRAQSHRAFALHVRDDGSTDGTWALLEREAQQDERLRLVRDERGRLGAAQNVSALLERSGAGYVFLCDQDDLWAPTKVERQLAVLQRAERQLGADRPILTFSDLEVVDDRLQPVSPSFFAYRALDARRGTTFGRLLIRNLIVGCTIGMNAALRDLARPIPAAAYMHDWWIALTAAAFGEILPLYEPLVRYRQHRGNVIGAGRTLVSDVLRAARSPAVVRTYYRKTRAQAAAFEQRFGGRVQGEAARALDAYLHARRPLRPLALTRAGIRDSSLLRDLALLAFG